MNVSIRHIVEQGESETVEFKTSFGDDVIVSLVAFANTNGGSVYVGVTDDGEVKGVDLGKETIQKWLNEIKNKTKPSLIPDVEIIEEQENQETSLLPKHLKKWGS